MCYAVVLKLILSTGYTPYYKPIAKNICKYAKRYDVSPYLILATIKHESNFKKNLISKTNDYGLMQVNKIHCKKCNLLDIKTNLWIGIRLMRRMRSACIKYHNHKSHWFRHYNWRSYSHHINVLKLARGYKDGRYKLVRKKEYKKILGVLKNTSYESFKREHMYE
jgi:hypothetical protein